MWSKVLSFIILLPFLYSCARPKGTVLEDKSFAEEELVKFCLLGDLGMDTEHQETIARALRKAECNRIYFLGDLIYPKGIQSVDDPELQDKFLNFYLPLIEENPSLVIGLLLGNHDHEGDTEAWLELAKRNTSFYFPNYYYMVDYGGLCFVALDTSFYYYKEEITETAKQTAWITSLNERLKECDVKVAMTHHPYKGGGYSGSNNWEGSQGTLKNFFDTYIIGKFDMLISGHVHVLADDGKDEGTKLLISGTGGENRGTEEKSGFVVLTWNPQNPKRLGYRLQEIDTKLNLTEDSEEQQERHHYEEVINKEFISNSVFARFWGWLTTLFY